MKTPKNYWYPLLESKQLKSKPIRTERIGLFLVFWRTSDGAAHASLDRCPHLGAALSDGKITNDRIVCPYHGFEFDGKGQCRHIPAIGKQGKIPKGMAIEKFNLQERHGFIWLWWGDAQEISPLIPFFSQLNTDWKYVTTVSQWPVHYTRAIENQLDLAHLPFVHRTTIGAAGESFVEGPYLEVKQGSIMVWINYKRDDGQPERTMEQLAEAAKLLEPGLEFLFPGVWLLNLGKQIKNVIAFVPVNDSCTLYYVRVYYRNKIPLLSKLFAKVTSWLNLIILNQDRRVITQQTPQNSLMAEHDKLMAADRAIIAYRKMLTEALNKLCKTF